MRDIVDRNSSFAYTAQLQWQRRCHTTHTDVYGVSYERGRSYNYYARTSPHPPVFLPFDGSQRERASSRTGTTRTEWRGRDDLKVSDGWKPTAYKAANCQLRPEVPQNTDWIFHRNSGMFHIYYRYDLNGSSVRNLELDPYSPFLDWDGECYLPRLPVWLVDESISALRNDMYGKQADIAVTFAEVAETGLLMHDTFKTAGRVLLAIIRKEPAQVVKALKDYGDGDTAAAIAGGTLAYNLGFRPLFNELYGLRDAVNAAFEEKPPLVRAYGRVSTELEIDEYRQGDMHYTGKSHNEVTHRVYLTVHDAYVQGLKTLGGINPFEIAWELVPLSFVADWFVDYGDYMSQLSSHIGLDYHSGSVTFFQRNESFFQRDQTWSSTPGVIVAEAFKREVLLAVPWPTLTYGNGIKSLGKLSTASALAALVASNWRKGPPKRKRGGGDKYSFVGDVWR